MRDLLVTVIIFGSVPVILFRPYVGILMFAWIGYMNPHRLTWGYAYDLPFAAVVGLATIIGFLVTKDKQKLPLNALMIVWLAWIFWMNITTIFALTPEVAWPEWDRAMKIQLTSLLALSLVNSWERLQGLIWVIALSIGFYGIKGGAFVIGTGGNHIVFGPPGTFFQGNNGLAVALLMVMPLFWYLRGQVNSKWMSRGMLIAMILIAASILGSYSRGAWLGLAASVVYLIYKSRHRLTLVPLVIVGLLVSLFFLPEQWFERASTIAEYEQDQSAQGRLNAWGFAINLAVDRPLVGGGFDTFTRELFDKYAPNPDSFADAHSIYFEALGEHGFVGLGLFLALGWLSLRRANQLRRMTRHREDLAWAYDLISMVQVCLVGYAVGGAFVGLAYFDLYYHLIVIILLTDAFVSRQLAAAHETGLVVPAGRRSVNTIGRQPERGGDTVASRQDSSG